MQSCTRARYGIPGCAIPQGIDGRVKSPTPRAIGVSAARPVRTNGKVEPLGPTLHIIAPCLVLVCWILSPEPALLSGPGLPSKPGLLSEPELLFKPRWLLHH